MSSFCSYCKEKTYFVINDDHYEVCMQCGFVQSKYYSTEVQQQHGHEDSFPEANQIDGYRTHLAEEEQERKKTEKKVWAMCQEFHKKSTVQKCIKLYHKLKKSKPKDKKLSNDKILKFAFYIASNREECPLPLPNFLEQSNLSLNQFKRISRLFHNDFVSEKPSQHLNALCSSLDIPKEDQRLINKVLNETSEHFEEHTLFTFLIVLLHSYSLYTDSTNEKLRLDRLCTLCDKKSKNNILKIMKEKGLILHQSYKRHTKKKE